MKKFIPKPEQFFYVPSVSKVRNTSTVVGPDGQTINKQTICDVRPMEGFVMFWCDTVDETMVKSYVVRNMNEPINDIMEKPVYHYIPEANFVLAGAEAIKDSMGEINLLMTYKRPEQVASELVIVPENAMEFLIDIIQK